MSALIREVTKPGRFLHLYDFLAHRFGHVAKRLESRPSRFRDPFTSSTRSHEVDRIEEVHAGDPLWPVDRAPAISVIDSAEVLDASSACSGAD